jgi:hypothetical protein
LNPNKLPNTLKSVKADTVSETIKIRNKFDKIMKPHPEINEKVLTTKEMLDTIPIVVAKQLLPPAGSNFDFIEP